MSKPPYPSQLQERYIVRMPNGMRDQIAEAARLNSRSMNSEIVARLAESFALETQLSHADASFAASQASLASLSEKLDALLAQLPVLLKRG